MKNLILSLAIGCCSAGCTVHTTPQRTIVQSPPVHQAHQNANCVWVNGYYTYRTQRVWVPGKWVVRVNRNGVRRKVWVPGRYKTSQRRHWVNGRYRCR